MTFAYVAPTSERVTRSGWLSLFMAVTTVNQIELLPVLCVALLPVWLLVTDRPELLIEPARHGASGDDTTPPDHA